MDSTEREDLDALTRSDGWRLFSEYCLSEWGPAGTRFHSAVKTAADHTNDADATAQLRQIIVAQREIQKLLAWPAERLKYLTQSEPELATGRDYSRRGGL